jgi:hypothetical protein
MNKIIILAVCMALVSCSQAPTPRPAMQLTPNPSPTACDSFAVEAWVDNPTPTQDSQVIVFGSLIKSGVYLGGIMMQAVWADETQERGVPNCDVLVTYGRGVCAVPVKDYEPGAFVPITVTFKYEGSTFVGHTGFTPQ